jgi:MerR HTH family regulatory protein
MNANALATIETIISLDPETTPEQKKVALNALKGTASKRRRLGTAKDAAGILKIHVKTLRQYEKRGLVTSIRYSRRKVRYDLDEIENLAFTGIETNGEKVK